MSFRSFGSIGTSVGPRATTSVGVMPLPKISSPFGVSQRSMAEADDRPVGQGEGQQHRARAERRLADDLGAIGVLDRAGHDLGRAGGVVVDEDHQRNIGRRRRCRPSRPGSARRRRSRGCRPSCRGQESARRLDRLVDVAARIAAQVEDDRGRAGSQRRVARGQRARRPSRRRTVRSGSAAMSVPGTIVHDTDGNLILARVIVKSSCSPVDGRWTVNGDLRALVAADHARRAGRAPRPSVLLPLTATITSPAFRPAVSAGLLGHDRDDDRLAVLLAQQHADADDVLIERVLLRLGLVAASGRRCGRCRRAPGPCPEWRRT